VDKQVMSLWAVTNGLLDDLPLADAKRFEAGFLEFMELSHRDIGAAIKDSGDLSDETEGALRAAVTEYKATFAPSGPTQVLHAPEADALETEEQEVITTRQRPTREEFEKKAGPAGGGSEGAP
jgi:F-type H+-transporting ATPase subunit alpha